jgi:hypothetical protein
MPATLVGWAALFGALRLSRRRKLGALVAGAALLSAALAPVGLLADRGVFRPVVSDKRGPFGTAREPVPAVIAFETRSGLRLHELARGDQCFELLLCAAPPLDRRLRLRGLSVSDGFSLGGG